MSTVYKNNYCVTQNIKYRVVKGEPWLWYVFSGRPVFPEKMTDSLAPPSHFPKPALRRLKIFGYGVQISHSVFQNTVSFYGAYLYFNLLNIIYLGVWILN